MANQTLDNVLFFSNGYGVMCANDSNHQIVIRGDRNGTAGDSTNYYQYSGTLASGNGHKFWGGGVIGDQTLKFQISNDGNYFACKVGIGTSSPQSRLHVYSNVTTDGLIVENCLRNITTFKSTGEHMFMYLDSAHQCIYQPAIFFQRASTTYSELRLQRASSSDPLGNYTESEGVIGSTGNTPFSIQSCGVRRLYLSAAGNVGVNTLSPSARLEVDSVSNGTNAAGFFASGLTSTNSTYIKVGKNLSAANNSAEFSFKYIADNCATNIASIGFYGNGSLLNVLASGAVGIGTQAPSYKLHVNGTFYAAGSSQDYKQSVCQYDTDSCMFMKLKPVTYQYKEEYKHLGKELKSETQIGLIAEEVAETYPELAILVKENDSDVVRNVDYEKLSIVLLAEVQKLRKEVDDLKTK